MGSFTMRFRIAASTPKGHVGRTAKRAAFAVSAKRFRRWARTRAANRQAMLAQEGPKP